MNRIRVFAPATIGNVSVGFDALGLAISPLDGSLLGDIVTLESADLDDWRLEVTGDFANELPDDPEQNIVLVACRRFEAVMSDRSVEIHPLSVTLEKRLPIGTGLGSSAASVVAALEALNRFHRYPLGAREQFGLMAELEGSVSGGIHTDNIGPCLFGGLRLCPPGNTDVYALPWPATWQVVVCWPGSRLETKASRAVLPEEVPLATAARQSAAFAAFVHALHSGNPALASASLVDLLAEPHRMKLLPGFEKARDALAGLGALAVGIAGSGPSLFSVFDNPESARTAAQWLNANYRANERGFVHVCRAEQGGARSIA
ncbi:MAG: homoserine kinase [Xanthomonadales bacterium]|nr:homoserine kinase [Xanthomonadales bacterium]